MCIWNAVTLHLLFEMVYDRAIIYGSLLALIKRYLCNSFLNDQNCSVCLFTLLLYLINYFSYFFTKVYQNALDLTTMSLWWKSLRSWKLNLFMDTNLGLLLQPAKSLESSKASFLTKMNCPIIDENDSAHYYLTILMPQWNRYLYRMLQSV